MSRRAIFLDKDGTLIVNVPYNADPAKVQLMPGADALTQLHDDYDSQSLPIKLESRMATSQKLLCKPCASGLVDLMRELW